MATIREAVTVYDGGVFLLDGRRVVKADSAEARGAAYDADTARRGTISAGILAAHNTPAKDAEDGTLHLKFDSLTSHDITYVGIIQTARASGLEKFPVPYILTNCHNSLCAVGGTINQDDHVFALSAAKKYGGIYVPPNLAVIHSYNREMAAAPGRMILGSDSHTRYGALGTMAVGEGGGELAKQLLCRSYDFSAPPVLLVHLTGACTPDVGPHDVALYLIAALFKSGAAKNKVLEFSGSGIDALSVDFRNGIDVMTTETACWSSVWRSDSKVADYLAVHGRAGEYKELRPADIAYYDGCVTVDLSKIEPAIALPFHPSNVYTIREFKQNASDILQLVENEALDFSLGKAQLNLRAKLDEHGDLYVDQSIIAGCAGGTYENICAAAAIYTAAVADGASVATYAQNRGAFSLSVYPDSLPNYAALAKNGVIAELASCGIIVREAFCGPCFGAGDPPENGALSIRHTTRNFPSREGSKPGEGQCAAVALMDARSIAATAAAGGRLRSASELDFKLNIPEFHFDGGIYKKRVFDFTARAEKETELIMGPNIKDWPAMPRLAEKLIVKIVSFITDEVTTTDELIPSGETSAYRSNPLRLAEFTLSRKDPAYVGKAKAVADAAQLWKTAPSTLGELSAIVSRVRDAGVAACADITLENTLLGSAIYARKPGDGSAREQAASCQRVLGGAANFALEYATKRYRSNLINWGILPFVVEKEEAIKDGGYIVFPNILQELKTGAAEISAYAVDSSVSKIKVTLGALTEAERDILLAGCLINYYGEG
jgi:aconitate hydratase